MRTPHTHTNSNTPHTHSLTHAHIDRAHGNQIGTCGYCSYTQTHATYKYITMLDARLVCAGTFGFDSLLVAAGLVIELVAQSVQHKKISVPVCVCVCVCASARVRDCVRVCLAASSLHRQCGGRAHLTLEAVCAAQRRWITKNRCCAGARASCARASRHAAPSRHGADGKYFCVCEYHQAARVRILWGQWKLRNSVWIMCKIYVYIADDDGKRIALLRIYRFNYPRAWSHGRR